jgi:hypothetical protein
LQASRGRVILSLFGCGMKTEDLTQIVAELSPEEQTAVREFVAFLKEHQNKKPAVTFSAALDEFINTHHELLRRLAQ